MNCWICGDKGTTGEHLIKATDIKGIFPEITQQNPVLYQDDEKKAFVGSAKSNRFKSSALICARCNNERTQPYDKAWEKLSKHLRGHPLHERGPLKIRLNKVFNHHVYENSLYIHLFFVKLFGCRIAQDPKIPIDIASFSDSILNTKPNPYVFLLFRKATGNRIKALALTSMQARFDIKGPIVAGWTYSVDELNVEILYSRNSANSPFLKESFHPSCRNRYIKFNDFTVDE